VTIVDRTQRSPFPVDIEETRAPKSPATKAQRVEIGSRRSAS
jgi:hypothetical protein